MEDIEICGGDFLKSNHRKKGGYQCTICYKFDENTYATYVMDLFWNPDNQTFKDNRRQNVFDTYSVYGCGDRRLSTERIVDRTDEVVAWRKLPKPLILKNIKYYESE